MGEPVRRCHYEVLGIEDRQCEEDDIRRAYKRAALRCHPDRNHGNEEAAQAEFKEVQNAYTVLVDPDERAWYDSHRDAILRGDNDGTCAPDELNLFPYFSAGCFDGFGAGEGGFYQVYAKVFETIVKEEAGYNAKIKAQAPSFGDAHTPYGGPNEGVAAFYLFWRNFITNKTFAWKDEHKLNEIPDRMVRREAERINIKVRCAARKEYTQMVVQLANHVYHTDPRVAAELERSKLEAAEKAAERAEREAEAARRRREANKKIWEEAAEKEERDMAEREARGEQLDGTTLEVMYEMQRQMERDRKAGRVNTAFVPSTIDDDEGGAGGDATKTQHFRCGACKKTFNNDKMWEEHVNSSKHKTQVKKLEKAGTNVAELLQVPEGYTGTGAPSAAPEAAAAEASASPPAGPPTRAPKSTAATAEADSDDDGGARSKKVRPMPARVAKIAKEAADSDDEKGRGGKGKGKDKGRRGGKGAKSPEASESSDDEPVVVTRNAFAALPKKKRR